MRKISTPKTKVKTPQHSPDSDLESFYTEKPSAQIISNILNYSKALEVKTTSSGIAIELVGN